MSGAGVTTSVFARRAAGLAAHASVRNAAFDSGLLRALTIVTCLLVLPAQALAQPLTGRVTPDSIKSWSPLARLLADAQSLVDARQFRAAWRLLEPYADIYAGDAQFDFLLGMAALESGRPGEAVPALERVLSNDPQRWRIRSEVARAYAALEEQEIARREFEALASRQLPSEAQARIGPFLNAVSRVRDQPDPLVQTHAEIRLGWDDSVVVSSDNESWVLASATRITPALTDSLPTASVGLGAGIRVTAAINGRLQWTTGLSGSLRSHPSAHQLDQQQTALSTGFVYRNQCHQLKMLGQAQLVGLDYDPFREAAGLIGQWQCDLDTHRQLGGFVYRFEFRFPDQEDRDASRQALGLSYAHLLPSWNDAIVLGSAHTGREYSQGGRADLSHDFAGFRVMLIQPVSEGLRGSIGLSYEHRRFDRRDPLAGAGRDDHETAVTLGLQHDIADHWTLGPQLVLTNNRSSDVANDFSRTQAQLVAQYRH